MRLNSIRLLETCRKFGSYSASRTSLHAHPQNNNVRNGAYSKSYVIGAKDGTVSEIFGDRSAREAKERGKGAIEDLWLFGAFIL